MSDFGARLRKARSAVGLTQDQLGFAVGLSKQAVSEWENNRGFPSFQTWPRLKAALQVSLDDLICGDSDGASRANDGHNLKDGDRQAYGSDAAASQRARDQDEFALLLRFRAMEAKRRKALLDLLKP